MNLRTWMKAVITLLLLTGLLLVAWPTSAQAQGRWEWQNPLPQGNTLPGVWGSSGSDVFAVGQYGTLLHYDGTGWSAMNSGTTKHLNGVWGKSESDVFAVGSQGTILHYNGATWSAMSSGTTMAYLNGVWGSSGSDVFAVGDRGTILHYDGTAWNAMISGTDKVLNDVWGSSGSDVFAVGWPGTILHYAGICPKPLTDVTISGPVTVFTGRAWPFSAGVLPVDATQPITYTWAPEPGSGQGTRNVANNWANTGTVTLTLEAENCGALVTDTHRVDVRQPFPVYLPLVLREW
jgi:hypothetical protein